MRWVASLAALGLMMALFHRFTAAGPVEARATLALGFLLLAGAVGGDLAHHFRLSRLLGFLAVGFAVGPAWLGLVRRDEVGALGVVTQAGTAVLAFGAGNVLTLAGLRAERAGLLRVLTATMGFPFVVTTGVVLTVGPWFPLTVHQPAGDVLAVALVLGAFAAVSSSVVTYALRADLAARGPTTHTILGASVLQDLTGMLLLCAALAAGRLLSSPGALALGTTGVTMARILGGIALGAACGLLPAETVPWLVRRPAFVLLAVVGLAVGLARALQLEPVIVALVAGVCVRARAPALSEGIKDRLTGLVLPAAAVTFTLAGAGLERTAFSGIAPWVVLLAGLRVMGLWWGLRWAGRHPAVTPVMARTGWLGFISQGGLVVGMAAVARRAFPEWGVSLEALVLAMIGVYQIAGPLCFGLGLRLAGEVTEERHVAEQSDTRHPDGDPRYSSL